MSLPIEVARWRRMGVAGAELRRCVWQTQLDRHNRAIDRTARRGLDYERMQKQRQAMAAALLDGLASFVRPHAPEAKP